MARDFDDIKREEKTRVDVYSQAREMDNAFRERTFSQSNTIINSAEILVALEKMEKLFSEQKQFNDNSISEIKKYVEEIKTIHESIKVIKDNIVDENEIAQNLILNGVTKAQKEAADEAVVRINSVADEAENHLRALERESRAKVNKVIRASIPDKLFQILKWVIATLFLLIALRILIPSF